MPMSVTRKQRSVPLVMFLVSTEGTTTEDGKQKAYSDAEKSIAPESTGISSKTEELESKCRRSRTDCCTDSHGSAKDENSSLDKKF